MFYPALFIFWYLFHIYLAPNPLPNVISYYFVKFLVVIIICFILLYLYFDTSFISIFTQHPAQCHSLLFCINPGIYLYVSACSTYILIPLSYLFSAQCHLLSFLLIHSGYHVFFIPPYLYFDISFISILPPFPIISYNSWWFSWYILSIYILRSPSILEVNFWRLERYLDL